MTAKRVDALQPAIVAALRAVGAAVQHLHRIGRGCPDLLVWFRGQLYLLELKSPRGRLTAEERAWHEAWPGVVYVVRSVDEALAAIGAVRYWAEAMLPPSGGVRVVQADIDRAREAQGPPPPRPAGIGGEEEAS